LTASELYTQCTDKQRVLITGGGSKLIAALVCHVLTFNHRKFDTSLNGNAPSVSADAPVVIIESDLNLFDYKHHILVLGNSASDDILDELEGLANATPKGGTLIYPKNNSALNKTGSKERTDVQSLAYEVYKHDKAEGKTILISSTKERIPVELSGDDQLACVSAAKELLKKIGISSGQFYRAISTYKSA
jgi:UDP-N-acetylmuramate: L-alanyl-gamma-D-glutamyl-meso-diaminopimelate ligase